MKKIAPCKPEVATRHSGYLIGGTSPFGTRKSMPIYLERSVLALPTIYINGGRRGYLLGMPPAELTRVLAPILVDVALEE
jgi:Cys-tRNA(Pro) deacylase